MFPLQPKVCLFIQNQKERKRSTKGNISKANNQRKKNIKALKQENQHLVKINNLFMYKKKNKRKQNFCPFLKF